MNIIHDRVFTFKKRSFEQWNSPPGALYQTPQPGLTTEIKSPPNGHVMMDEQFSAVIHIKQTMKRSNAPILTMIRNLWTIPGCHEIILNVMCDIKLTTIQNEINSFLSKNITVSVVDNTENCNSFSGYYSVEPTLKPVLHLTDEVVLLPSEVEFGFSVFKHYPTTISGWFSLQLDEIHVNDTESRWKLNANATNSFNIITTQAFWIHRDTMEIMKDIIPLNIQRFSKDHPECDDILLNFVAADVSSIPPGSRKF